MKISHKILIPFAAITLIGCAKKQHGVIKHIDVENHTLYVRTDAGEIRFTNSDSLKFANHDRTLSMVDFISFFEIEDRVSFKRQPVGTTKVVFNNRYPFHRVNDMRTVRFARNRAFERLQETER
ncbi:MAG: hypothetical protein FWF34_00965 [Alphaproteobacteria bacterium]|nr:hypothetical protein [Alphaproteobacteria bacterium]MCL2889815.1 hypothetical protein [Alphaproteobacteria bacterium]